jgi:hypothetical protein
MVMASPPVGEGAWALPGSEVRPLPMTRPWDALRANYSHQSRALIEARLGKAINRSSACTFSAMLQINASY